MTPGRHSAHRGPRCPSAATAFAAALQGQSCRVVGSSSDTPTLPTWRWSAEADASDLELLRRCTGATVDIGCGPGRMTHALQCRGVMALGIDIVAEAITQTLARGGMALHRDVFSVLPGEGRWQTALLADGNIGIGGDPVRLLRRVADLLDPSGRIVVDLARPGGPIRVDRISLEVGGVVSRPFRWAVIPADQLELLAEASALRVLELVDLRGRWFAQLGKQG